MKIELPDQLTGQFKPKDLPLDLAAGMYDALPASRLLAAERLLLRVEVEQLCQELDSAFDHYRAYG